MIKRGKFLSGIIIPYLYIVVISVFMMKCIFSFDFDVLLASGCLILIPRDPLPVLLKRRSSKEHTSIPDLL